MLIDKYINLGLEIVSRSPCRCVVYSHGCSGCHRIWGGQTKILIPSHWHVRHFTSVLNSKKYSVFFPISRHCVNHEHRVSHFYFWGVCCSWYILTKGW